MELELADIFLKFGEQYRRKYAENLLPSHRKAMKAIERCRTQRLGGQVFACPECCEKRYSYHSCRNRHCPKCQQQKTQEWLNFQRELLLPAPYFLLTFTLPSELRQIARQNQKLVYNLLFRTSAHAAQKLAEDPRFIGGQIGLIGVLHTWTRKLDFHPHVHYLAPAGGLAPDGRTWLPASKRFFLPVKALSKLFRAAFQKELRKTPLFELLPANIWRKKWVVHAKPVGNGNATLKYLAPYIYRIAISNRRLLALSPGSLECAQVTFSYCDSKNGKTKRTSLPAEKFIHHFLQHVLPRGFVKVRYYGFFAARARTKLKALQLSLGALPASQSPKKADASEDQPPTTCPQCGTPMLFIKTIQPERCRSP
ncbi:MAG: IS91 family transposase [Anaerolineae bacterium]|nr:IS91 family transposase [Anaerolineae bacterium]MBT7989141.1 IS91 family transposase [Anaerolineae bacterium]